MSALALLVSAAGAVRVWIPDSVPAHLPGDTVDVPLLIANHVGQGVIAADISVRFSEDSLSATSGWRLGNAVPAGWTALTNPFPCSLLIGMAGFDPLVAGDTLLVVELILGCDDSVVPVWLSRCRLNEGQVACTTRAGFIGIGAGRSSACRRLAVSPNPSRGRLVVRTPDAAAGRILVWDASGRCTAATTADVNGCGELDIGDQRAGCYVVEVRSATCRLSMRVVKLE